MFEESIAWAPSVWFAFITCLGSSLVYFTLVPLHKNPGAKRLAFLLVVCLLLLAVTLMRIYHGDYGGRFEFISVAFIALGLAFTYMGWSIWTDQREGAQKYRRVKGDSTPSE